MPPNRSGEVPANPDGTALTLDELEASIARSSLPPVQQWQPTATDHMDLVIKRDGRWQHEGTVIKRERMVRLFSTILRLEPDGSYCLVTPALKLIIEVEDAPFIATSMTVFSAGNADSVVAFETNVGDRVILDHTHPLQVESDASGHPRPYIEVRDGLRALLSRSVYYELAEHCVEHGADMGVYSRNQFHSLSSS